MPLYVYFCECGVEERLMRKMSDRHDPLECRVCGLEMEMEISTPQIVSGVGDNITSKTPEFYKDKLREINNQMGTKIDV